MNHLINSSHITYYNPWVRNYGDSRALITVLEQLINCLFYYVIDTKYLLILLIINFD